jgi:uncharacterized membrane protein
MDPDQKHTHSAYAGMPKNRVESLVDGIFGVAMTLLVLDIKVPQGLAFSTDAAIRSTLWGQASNFRIYLISFIVLGLYWVAHHVQFHLVRNVDRVVIWINLLFMLGVTMVPFSTSLLGEYGHLMTPCVIYGCNLLWLAALYWIQASYLERNRHLASSALTPIAARRVRRQVLLFIGVPLISMAVAFVNPWLSVHFYFLLIVLANVPGKIDTAVESSTESSPSSEA